jgi:uncharacterized protein
MDLALLCLALVGHAALWVGFINRAHAAGFVRSFMHVLTFLGFACLGGIPLGVGFWLAQRGFTPWGPNDWQAFPRSLLAYFALCWALGAARILWWIWRHATHRPPDVLRWHRSRFVRLARREGQPGGVDHLHHFLARLPGNQILHLDFAERELDVPRLSPALDGLTIVHLSDTHFTGRVGKAFFQEVVHLSNEQEPDLVAVTGDLVDASEYIDWIPDTLGRLTARHGVFFVLGNHDLKADVTRLRRTLIESGLVDLGGRWVKIEASGVPMVLAGNELPWFPPAADMQHAPPRGADGQPLRILLSHSPDQFDWAIRHDFDVMLAGHLHGGQIRIPWIGPIFAPSRQGIRFASGTFYRRPTILHVNRGLSGELPIRLNCPPELTKLVLRAGGRPSAS